MYVSVFTLTLLYVSIRLARVWRKKHHMTALQKTTLESISGEITALIFICNNKEFNEHHVDLGGKAIFCIIWSGCLTKRRMDQR